MKKLILISIFIISQISFAIEAGKYDGVTAQGGPCTITINSISFIEGVHDPINQRFDFQMGALKSTLQYLPIIRADRSEVDYDHDHLTGTLVANGMRMAFILTVSHSGGHETITKMERVYQDFNHPTVSSTVQCLDLKIAKK